MDHCIDGGKPRKCPWLTEVGSDEVEACRRARKTASCRRCVEPTRRRQSLQTTSAEKASPTGNEDPHQAINAAAPNCTPAEVPSSKTREPSLICPLVRASAKAMGSEAAI